MKYRIAWRSLLTGYTGHGEFIFDESTAREIAQKMNRIYRNVITHWIEAGE